MSDNKQYYYLKLKDNFFDSNEIKILERMENGVIYSNILLKMYLKSLKREGELRVNDRIPYNSAMLASVLNQNKDIIEKAINIFCELELIEMLDDGSIFMLDIQNFIGTSSTEADRKRAYRNQINERQQSIIDRKIEKGQMSDKCLPNVQDKGINATIENKDVLQEEDICPPEIDLEKEKKKEKDIKKEIFLDKDLDLEKDNNSFTDKNKKSMELRKDPKFLSMIENVKGKLSIYDCPSCGKPLMEKELNGSIAWCHPDYKTGECSSIFNNKEELDGFECYEFKTRKHDNLYMDCFANAKKGDFNLNDEVIEILTSKEIEILKQTAEKNLRQY